ncbi:MAG: S41 family peptidase [Candidatus Omnitrophota bacterium]
MRFFRLGIYNIVLAVLFLMFFHFHGAARAAAPVPVPAHQAYLPFFEEIYTLMQEHYFFEVSRTDFNHFLDVFDAQIYPDIVRQRKSADYIRWRSAAYLVDMLKQPDDLFSRFWPPKPAEQFAKEVFGKKIDLGIDGHLVPNGMIVDFVEPRSDAYEKGLRENDLIVRIGQEDVLTLSDARLKESLNPLEGARVVINYFSGQTKVPHAIEVFCREYFKQTVFLRSTGVPDIYCLEIPKFNKGTPDDFSRLLGFIGPRNPKGLVIDLRDNPGGPPLAARAISSFFLPSGGSLIYFEGRKRPRADLDIPVIPSRFKVAWPVAILVNKGTGSASELFSGVMQDNKRAVVIGEQTAGQVLLKSMFDLSDGSTLALVNARGHFPDGRPFPFDGVIPDETLAVTDKAEGVALAAKYLYVKSGDRR